MNWNSWKTCFFTQLSDLPVTSPTDGDVHLVGRAGRDRRSGSIFPGEGRARRGIFLFDRALGTRLDVKMRSNKLQQCSNT